MIVQSTVVHSNGPAVPPGRFLVATRVLLLVLLVLLVLVLVLVPLADGGGAAVHCIVVDCGSTAGSTVECSG